MKKCPRDSNETYPDDFVTCPIHGVPLVPYKGPEAPGKPTIRSGKAHSKVWIFLMFCLMTSVTGVILWVFLIISGLAISALAGLGGFYLVKPYIANEDFLIGIVLWTTGIIILIFSVACVTIAVGRMHAWFFHQSIPNWGFTSSILYDGISGVIGSIAGIIVTGLTFSFSLQPVDISVPLLYFSVVGIIAGACSSLFQTRYIGNMKRKTLWVISKSISWLIIWPLSSLLFFFPLLSENYWNLEYVKVTPSSLAVMLGSPIIDFSLLTIISALLPFLSFPREGDI